MPPLVLQRVGRLAVALPYMPLVAVAITVRVSGVAFDPVLQTPDFGKAENVRRLGLVDVDVASDVDIERTNRFMGSSSLSWAEPLAAAGLLARGESVVAFCDYDYPAAYGAPFLLGLLTGFSSSCRSPPGIPTRPGSIRPPTPGTHRSTP